MTEQLRIILGYSLLTAIATGLGALPFFFVKNISKEFLWISYAIAAILMITASFQMIHEGLNHGWRGVIGGIIIGILFIILASQFIHRHEHLKFEGIQGLNAGKILLLLGVMTAHSFTEGIAMGFSFGPSRSLGIFIALAIAIQNIPEGLAISLVMVPKGVSRWKAGLWSIFSSLPQPLMAIPAFLFVSTFKPLLSLGLGFAAGAMIWMALSELLPEAFKHASAEKIASRSTLAVALMIALQFMIS